MLSIPEDRRCLKTLKYMSQCTHHQGHSHCGGHGGRIPHAPYHVPRSQLCWCLCPCEPILAHSAQSATWFDRKSSKSSSIPFTVNEDRSPLSTVIRNGALIYLSVVPLVIVRSLQSIKRGYSPADQYATAACVLQYGLGSGQKVTFGTCGLNSTAWWMASTAFISGALRPRLDAISTENLHQHTMTICHSTWCIHVSNHYTDSNSNWSIFIAPPRVHHREDHIILFPGVRIQKHGYVFSRRCRLNVENIYESQMVFPMEFETVGAHTRKARELKTSSIRGTVRKLAEVEWRSLDRTYGIRRLDK